MDFYRQFYYYFKYQYPEEYDAIMDVYVKIHHLQSRIIEDKVQMLGRMLIDRQTYQSSIMMDYYLFTIDDLKKIIKDTHIQKYKQHLSA
jgi:hypothetical protein